VSRNPIRIVRIIDRMNIGGPAKHVACLSSQLDSQQFETVLIIGSSAAGEGDMSYLTRQAGIEPVVILEMSREIGIRDGYVILRLLRAFFRFKPQIIHTHKPKAGAAGRFAARVYKWLTPSALWLRHVPPHLVDRPKSVFEIPLESWLRGPLREWAEALLSERRLPSDGFFDPRPIRQKWSEHLSGKRAWQYHLWDILMFQTWLDGNSNSSSQLAHSAVATAKH